MEPWAKARLTARSSQGHARDTRSQSSSSTQQVPGVPGNRPCGPEVCKEREVPRPLLQPTLATSIQCSTTRALSGAFILWSPRQVVMTQLATLLNWATVARMVGARCSLPFLSRWDQMEPRQW